MDRFNCLNVLNVDVEGQLLRYMTWQHLYAWNIYFGIADLLKCQSTRKDCEWVFFALIWFLSYLWKVSLLNVAKGWRSLAEGRYGSLASLFLKPLKAGQALYLHWWYCVCGQIHRKSARHQAAAVKLEEKEFRSHNEVQKRIALAASDRTMPTNSGTLQNRKPSSAAACSPLAEATRKRTAQALAAPAVSHLACEQGTREATNQKQKVGRGEAPFFSPKSSKSPTFSVAESSGPLAGNMNTQQSGLVNMQKEQAIAVSSVPLCLKGDQSWQKERERQLRLREAGWRLDGNGKWFKEENVCVVVQFLHRLVVIYFDHHRLVTLSTSVEIKQDEQVAPLYGDLLTMCWREASNEQNMKLFILSSPRFWWINRCLPSQVEFDSDEEAPTALSWIIKCFLSTSLDLKADYFWGRHTRHCVEI